MKTQNVLERPSEVRIIIHHQDPSGRIRASAQEPLFEQLTAEPPASTYLHGRDLAALSQAVHRDLGKAKHVSGFPDRK
jgi:hypothetical protein